MPLHNKEEHIGCVFYATDESALFRQYRLSDGMDIPDINKGRHALLYLAEGRLRITLGNTLYTIEHGMLMFLPNNIAFIGQAFGSCHFIASFYAGHMPLCNRYDLFHMKRDMYHVSGTSTPKKQKRQLAGCEEIIAFYSELSHHLDEGLNCLNFHRLKQEELCILLRAYYSKEDLCALLEAAIDFSSIDFKRFVLQNYQYINDVDFFASLANMSTRNFQRKFKAEFGQSARKWLNERRSECILRDLRTTDKSLSSIAESYGFVSLSYFSTFCRQYFGMTPLELRKGSKEPFQEA